MLSGVRGANPSCYWAKGSVHPGHVAYLSQWLNLNQFRILFTLLDLILSGVIPPCLFYFPPNFCLISLIDQSFILKNVKC